MDRKLCSVMLVLFLGISVSSFAQGQGQNRGPGGPPPAVANLHIEHGGGDHGPSDHANKPSEPNKSLNSGRNDVATRLSADTKLSSKLQAMLPAGMTVQTAAMGFKNLGQFIAAVHVSKNLNIPFDQLKGAVVTNHKSLGDAIHDLKPDLSTETAKTEAKKAEDEAKDDTRKPS